MSKIWDSASKQVLLSVNHKSERESRILLISFPSSLKGPVVSSILRRNVWRFSELSSTKSSSCFYSPSLHLKAFQKHSNYKTEAVSEHIITLSTRPLHMVMMIIRVEILHNLRLRLHWFAMLQLRSMAAKLCSLRDMQGLY